MEVAVQPPVLAACPKCGWDLSVDIPAEPAPEPVPELPPVAYDQVPPTWDLTMNTKAYG